MCISSTRACHCKDQRRDSVFDCSLGKLLLIQCTSALSEAHRCKACFDGNGPVLGEKHNTADVCFKPRPSGPTACPALGVALS